MPFFNIRVYALFINEKQEVLVADEFRFGKEMTKFPGGGLIWGEGTIDCLKRECKEELGCEIKVIKHFYTTDFFQLSAFHANHQLISIYYLVKNTSPLLPSLNTNEEKKDGMAEGSQTFRWISLTELSAEAVTFPIDKKVAVMLSLPAQIDNMS